MAKKRQRKIKMRWNIGMIIFAVIFVYIDQCHNIYGQEKTECI